MFERKRMIIIGLLLVVLFLGGCFRQASPDLQPPNNVVPTAIPTALPTELPTQVPFVTAFPTGEGPDADQLPPLAEPSATLALVEPGVTNAASSEDTTSTDGASEDAGILPVASATVPFAAGPTYTPRPGEPPVDLSPNVAATSESNVSSGVTALGADCVYVVQAGDSAFYIATLYGLTLNDLAAANELDSPDRLSEGQELLIPNCGEDSTETSEESAGPTAVIDAVAATPTSVLPPPVDEEGNTIHVVQAGENLFRISLQYGVTVDDIVVANGLGSADAILAVGQALVIPQQ